ncbi:MAG: hypothetical protein ACQEUZ_02190 [Pseudomonadota bacterium]
MGFLLHMGATVLCMHGGRGTATSASPRVRLGGQSAVTLNASWAVAGCPFATPEPAPKPCATIRFLTPAARVRIGGEPAVLSTATGVCLGPMGVQGAPQVVAQQTRVRGQ